MALDWIIICDVLVCYTYLCNLLSFLWGDCITI